MLPKRNSWGVCTLVIALWIMPEAVGADYGVSAITAPSADIDLSFIQAGRIAEVLVKEGDAVTEGQLMVKQDDDLEQVQLAQIEAKSKDRTQIQAAEATLAQKRVDLKKLEWAAERDSATELEVEHARLDVLIAVLSLEMARFEHAMDQLKYEDAKLRAEYRLLKTPIAGRVERVQVEVGETLNVQNMQPAVRIVRIDPLWIDVQVPLQIGRTLKVDQAAQVRVTGTGEAPIDGKVIFVSSVADAGSSTLRVRVEASNPTRRPAGEHVGVTFKRSGNP